MSVQFILGRSGTGKTKYCIRSIVDNLSLADDDKSLIFLVPEQASYEAERAILSESGIAGYSRLKVLSFERLVFLLAGKNRIGRILSGTGRQMIVHKILRDNKSQLKVLGASANWPGLSRQLYEVIGELYRYDQSPEDVDGLIAAMGEDKGNKLTAMKFSDIALVFDQYLKFIEGRFIDSDAQLSLACEAAAEAEFIKGAKLWVDGFSSFTVAETAILAELTKAVENTQIALCLDPAKINTANPVAKQLDPVSLFNPTEETYAELFELAKKCKLKLEEPIILDESGRFDGHVSLGHIEKNLFSPQAEKIAAQGNIKLVSAPNLRQEVQFVAGQILNLVKDGRCRYRDIAVIVSDIDSYQPFVRAYLTDYGIPFFIDNRKSLDEHVVVELICSALKVVVGGFSHSDIFAYLKCALLPSDDYGIDILENYCLAFGVSADDWQSKKKWSFDDKDKPRFDQDYVNRIRAEVCEPLLELRNKLTHDGPGEHLVSAEEFTRAVFDLLDTLKVTETIASFSEDAQSKGLPEEMEEHHQFYEKVVDLFDELVEVFGPEQSSCADYLAIVSSAFSQTQLALIPPTLDQVLVGSIERSRHPDLKAVFLMGVTEKQFPMPINNNSLLSDTDREAAESVDFALSATSNQTLAQRQYLAYIAFTRASGFLCISYPLADDKGSSVVRSEFVSELESLFTDLSETSGDDGTDDIDNVHNEGELAGILCSRLGKDSDSDALSTASAEQMLEGLCGDDQFSRLGLHVKSAMDYNNCAKLDDKLVAELFAGPVKTSATRLGSFAGCPYKYFSHYVLNLQERLEFKFRPLDVGNFYHKVLDGFIKKIIAEKMDIGSLDKDKLLRILHQQSSKLIKSDNFISIFRNHSPANAFLIDMACETLEDCVLAIAEIAAAGSFRPILSEAGFGNANDELGEYKLKLSDGRDVFVRGKIDRVDRTIIDGKQAIIVFDYKKSSRSFAWDKFYYGLDMQLAIYMLAGRNGYKQEIIAGAFYMPVEAAIKKIELSELAARKEKSARKAVGIFNGQLWKQLDSQASKDSRYYNFQVTKDGEPYGSYGNRGALRHEDFENVLRFAQKKIIELTEKIVRGEIAIAPCKLGANSACTNCEYKPLCRFDWRVNEFNYMESVDKKKVLEKVGPADA